MKNLINGMNPRACRRQSGYGALESNLVLTIIKISKKIS